MRTKSYGVKPGVSRSPQKPPSSTTLRPFPLLSPDDDEHANSSETSRKGDDDNINVVGDSGNGAEVREKGRSRVDWMEVEACVACDGGGKLLVCCVTDCPVSVHEKCATFKLTFDDLGRFYCPYCSYKRKVARARDLREKAMLAKKALSDFIDSGTVGGEASAKEKEDGGKGVEFDDGEVQNQDVRMEDDCRNDGDGLKVSDSDRYRVMVGDKMDALAGDADGDGSHNAHQSQQEETPGIDSLEDSMSKEVGNERNISEIHQFETSEHEQGKQKQEEDDSIIEESEQPEQSDEEGKQEQEEDGRFLDMSDSDTEEFVVRQKRVKFTGRKKTAQPKIDKPSKKAPPRSHTTPEKEAVNQNKRVTPSEKARESSEKLTNLCFPKEKRKRLHWTPEEEDMLKEGVKKFGTTTNKNLPWMKILEFGHHVFDSTRTPTDLKDKWKNIMAKGAKH